MDPTVLMKAIPLLKETVTALSDANWGMSRCHSKAIAHCFDLLAADVSGLLLVNAAQYDAPVAIGVWNLLKRIKNGSNL
jgi:hypothetical protein